MAYYRSRRGYRRTGRKVSRRFLKKKMRMAKIKRDIMKCNFPTKIKFMGLPEKKVMFLTKDVDLNNQFQDIILNPFDCENIKTLFGGEYIKRLANDRGLEIKLPNFDKMCILAIYVKLTPTKNMWNENGTLLPISCFYSMNYPSDEDDLTSAYDESMKNLKQKFVFNSNENFTIYIHKPSTITSTNGVIYKPGTWYSLAEFDGDSITRREVPMDPPDDGDNDGHGRLPPRRGAMVEEEDEDNEIVGGILDATLPKMSCGRLSFFSSANMAYKATISYKVALKG